MKFGQFLKDNVVPEWRSQYIDYKKIKKSIKHIVSVNLGLDPASHGPPNDQTAKRMDHEFTQVLDEQLEKVCAFFKTQYQFADQRLRVITRALQTISVATSGDAKRVSARSRSKLSAACMEYYRFLQMLKNYCVVNFTGFVKGCKKYDKYAMRDGELSRSYLPRVEATDFHAHSKLLDPLIDTTRDLYATHFCGGNRKKASERLRVNQVLLDPSMSRSRMAHAPSSLFRGGLLIGVIVTLIAILVSDLVNNYPWDAQPDHAAWTFNIYRGIGFVITLAFCLAYATHVWTEFQINYIFILDLNPRSHLHVAQYVELCGFFGALYMISIVLFVKTIIHESVTGQTFPIPAYVQPVAMVGLMIVIFAVPIPGVLYSSARYWLWRVMGRIVIAPFQSVNFADFFFADQLTSLTVFLADVQYTVCVVGGGSAPTTGSFCSGTGAAVPFYIMSFMPSMWRLLQCLRRYVDAPKSSRSFHPHLSNAFKYFLSVLVVWIAMIDTTAGISSSSSDPKSPFTPLRVLWLVVNIISTGYKMAWDFWMDWGLIPLRAPKERKFLSIKWFYPAAMAFNFIARYVWLLTFIISYSAASVSNWIVLLGFTEIFRRGWWSIIRVEHEHVNNAEHYRAVKDIPVPFVDDTEGFATTHIVDAPPTDTVPANLRTRSFDNALTLEPV